MSPTTAKDNLDSTQFVRVLDLIGEGETGGLVDGEKSVFFNNTPLENANGTKNFKDVLVEERTGQSSQSVIGVTANTSTTTNTNFSAIQQASPNIIQLTNPSIDAVKLTIAVPQLQEVTDKGDIKGAEIELKIDVQYSGGSYQTKVSGDDGKIKGRTGDLYQRDYLIRLDGAFPVNIKLTRITADSTNVRLTNDFIWTTYTQITYDQRAYNNSALIGLRISAEHLNNIPNRSYLVRGVKVAIPHNATVNSSNGSLSFSGLFNGTLSTTKQTTSCPVWCLWDLLTNERYGLNLDVNDLDVYSFYAASVYSNASVSDGFGGLEPRFSCNVNIQAAQEAYTIINQLCSIFRAQAFWSTSVMIAQDAPQDASYLFSNSNVLDPGFTYSSSSQKTRTNVAVVKYFDNELRDYQFEEVKDQTNINRYGSIVKNVDAFACTSRGQANRIGKWLLYMENNSETCSFVTSLVAGLSLRIGQIIEIADDVKSGSRRSGRIASATTTAITVDDATGLTTSNSPSISVILPDNSVENKTVTGISGNVISVSSAFTTVVNGVSVATAPNPNSVWVYETSNIQPSTWRIVAIEEQDETNYAVTCLTYNSTSYNSIENIGTLSQRDITDLNVAPAAPSGTDAEELIYENLGIARVKIIVSWTNTTDNAYVRFRFEDGNWESRLVERSKQLEILDVVVGTYQIEIYSVSASGLRSVDPANLTVNTIGKTALPTQVTGIKLIPINEQLATLKWNRSTEKDVLLGGQVLIRHSAMTEGATWGKATALFTGEDGISGNQTEAIIPLLEGTYLLKFQDDGGRVSPTPGTNLDADWDDVRIGVPIPDPTDRYLLQIVDETLAPSGSNVIGGFQGTKVNTVWESAIGSGKDALLLTVTNGATAASGTYTFYAPVDLGQTYDVNVKRILNVYSFGNESLWDDRTDYIDSWGFIDDVGALEADKCNAFLELRTTNDDPNASPTWGQWQEFTNNLITARGIQFRLNLSSADTNQNIAVTELGARIELQTRSESIQTPITTGSQPYQVNFKSAFNQPPSVFITQSAVNQEEGDYFVVDNITRTGFEITFKQTGSVASYARSFVWGATGYGKQVV
tara:strand:+ start:3631 stop:6894 length:3264 start_codon:yes stop_codon:yes gene_type:complete